MSEFRRVILLRHGRTAWNAERRFQGQADPPLDEVGRAQAFEVAPFVAALRPDRLITSDAERAAQTAQIIGDYAGLQPIADPRLRERALGHWEGLTRDEVALRYPDEFAAWLAGGDVTSRGGESREQVAERALAAFHDLPAEPTLVLVTHSATAMALTNSLLAIPQSTHPLAPLANCHWSEVYSPASDEPGVAGAGVWRLRGHNLGTPGTVLPLAHRREDELSDADA